MPSEDTGAIAGSVVTQADQAAVPGALVTLTEGGTSTAAVLTDDQGQFRFDDLKLGTYVLLVTPPIGFEPAGSGSSEVSLTSSSGATAQLFVVPIRALSRSIAPGTTDTLALASGVVVTAALDVGSSGVTVGLVDAQPTIPPNVELMGPSFRLQITPSASPASAALKAFGSGGGSLITMYIYVPAEVAERGILAFNGGTPTEPLFLYVNTTATWFDDPGTGRRRTVALATLQLPATEPLDVETMLAAHDLECDKRILRAVDGKEESDGRIPLILIHGWQRDLLSCDAALDAWNDEFDPFGPMISYLSSPDRAWIGHTYKLYVLRYPTFEPVAATSEYLWEQIEAGSLGSTPPVLLGHSMGGLVGRALMAAHGGDAVRGLITLGTPHEGSPLASLASFTQEAWNELLESNSAWLDANVENAGVWLAAHFLADSPGRDDLDPAGTFIQSLKNHEDNGGKIYTIGGVAAGFADLFYSVSARFLESLSGEPNDGAVPISSAVPSWTTLQTVLDNHDHSDLLEEPGLIPSVSEAVGSQIKAVLASLASCTAGPTPPDHNDFPLSGAVARVDYDQVQVTLNPVIIEGSPVTIGADNIVVIEDACVRDIAQFVTDDIGVDIAFVQDLSASMTDAITGVSSSVLSFANALAAQGVNARIGSVGYSGPGGIPTTPPNNGCEDLGPFQDLTDPSSFRSHVLSSWQAVGGCDGPENGLEAIEYAHHNLSWRPGAVRAYIDITDISHHTLTTNCNGFGPCTDQSLESIVALIGDISVIHAVAPSAESARTYGDGLDPWLLADRTGGVKLPLGNGYVDLSALGVADVIGKTVSFRFASSSYGQASHYLRIRVQVDGKVAELAPGLVPYDPSHRSPGR